ncbi:probable serine/threonine-protein kinase clkA [Vespa velutina]|uniref:probable serine/threonine-protein kinase clkA n=1 Tax=Vespa velutina TaxID=202808 RepID=UPI001FB20A2C|nr:probable serine/threonine-protein kinase clkA [Vespa velutina]
MARTKFYRIFTCSILMVHTAASTGNYYFKPDDRFEPNKHIFNGRYIPGDNINQKNINNYDTENQERDYAFNGRINKANLEVSNLPFLAQSNDNRLSGHMDTSYENHNNNLNFIKEDLPYHFQKYSTNSSNKEFDFGKYRNPDSSQYSSDHHHKGSSYTDFISGSYSNGVPSSFAPIRYEQDSDTSMADDTYINNHQQFYGKQKGNIFNIKGKYNYEDDALNIFSPDIFYMQEDHKTKDQIQGLNQNQSPSLGDLSSSVSNNYNSNIHGKNINFHKLERPINYRRIKYPSGVSTYPSKSNLNYVIKGHKNNHFSNSYAKDNGKAIIIKIGGSSLYPRYIYSTRFYPNTKGDVNRGYKKKRNNFLNRPRNNPVPVHSPNFSYNNNNINNNYDDFESSELYNRNTEYTDNISTNAFTT